MKTGLSSKKRSLSKEKMIVTYDDFIRLIDILAEQIKDYMAINGRFDGIIAIERGGLVPGVYLSHLLNLPIKHIGCGCTKILIVEDVIDTGETITSLHLQSGDKVAALIVKPWGSFNADFYGIESNKWIEFPWEK